MLPLWTRLRGGSKQAYQGCLPHPCFGPLSPSNSRFYLTSGATRSSSDPAAVVAKRQTVTHTGNFFCTYLRQHQQYPSASGRRTGGSFRCILQAHLWLVFTVGRGDRCRRSILPAANRTYDVVFSTPITRRGDPRQEHSQGSTVRRSSRGCESCSCIMAGLCSKASCSC